MCKVRRIFLLILSIMIIFTLQVFAQEAAQKDEPVGQEQSQKIEISQQQVESRMASYNYKLKETVKKAQDNIAKMDAETAKNAPVAQQDRQARNVEKPKEQRAFAANQQTVCNTCEQRVTAASNIIPGNTK